jgi:hypothetical protein
VNLAPSVAAPGSAAVTLSGHGPGCQRMPNTIANGKYKVPRTAMLEQVDGQFTPNSLGISADWLTHC